MKIEAIDLPARGVEDLRKVLSGLEVKLADAKAQRDKILLDIRKASAAVDKGDQRARFAQGGLNKEDAAAGRLILSLERQIAEARKRLAMAETQAATVEAKRHAAAAISATGRPGGSRPQPDGRVVRHRAASLAALQGALLKGYTVTAGTFGASALGFGGVAAQIGSDVPSIMAGLWGCAWQGAGDVVSVAWRQVYSGMKWNFKGIAGGRIDRDVCDRGEPRPLTWFGKGCVLRWSS